MSISGPADLLAEYLCGERHMYEVLERGRVSGDVCALSALHGITHAPDLVALWSERRPLVDAWVHLLDSISGDDS